MERKPTKPEITTAAALSNWLAFLPGDTQRNPNAHEGTVAVTGRELHEELTRRSLAIIRVDTGHPENPLYTHVLGLDKNNNIIVKGNGDSVVTRRNLVEWGILNDTWSEGLPQWPTNVYAELVGTDTDQVTWSSPNEPDELAP